MLDKDMREPLFDFLDEYFDKIRIIEEKVILKSRADVLGVIEGAITGFEIKSDSDTYERLPAQIKDYDKYCDYSYLVIGKSHAAHAAEHIPDYWGLICISEEGCNEAENDISQSERENSRIKVEVIRNAALCPKVKLANQFQLLWRNELSQLLAMNHLPKCTGKNKNEISKLLIEKVDNDLLREQFTELLFERDYNIFNEGSDSSDEKVTTFRKTKTGVRAKKKPAKKAVRKAPRPVGVKNVITGRRRKTTRKRSVK